MSDRRPECAVANGGRAQSRMATLNSPKPLLGDFFTNRQEPGRPGLPIMSVTMNESLVPRDEMERRTESALRPEQHLLVRKGDIVYNMMRMWQGACGLAEADGIVSPAYVVLAPRSGIDSRFAYLWFKSARMVHLFWAFSHGLTEDRLRLYFDEFAEIPAAPPSLSRQREIASVIYHWDKAISQADALAMAARARMDGLLRETIGNAQLASHKTKDWTRLELGVLAEFRSGGTPEKTKAEFWNGNIPWVSAKDLKSFEVTTAQDMLTEHGANEASIVPAGSILVLVRGMGLFKDIPLGISTRQVAFNQDIKALIPASGVNGRFVAYVLRASRKRLMDRVDRAGHGTGRLATDFLEALPIAFPDLALQNGIVEFLDLADIEFSSALRYAILLRSQKRAFVGKLLDS